MKLAIFSTIFAAPPFAAATDVQSVDIGPTGPPDGKPACSSFQDPKCCITSTVCQCYDGTLRSCLETLGEPLIILFRKWQLPTDI
ncbi:hypothetical protein PG994_002168 [Apiospora phragmitis]|uniref:Uncharacterized protein n=1 Tax=Apiospora phragmitis TaxID=2905665 RepID=A0ABR1WVK9_9PEZI